MITDLSYGIDDNEVYGHLGLPAPHVKWRARFGDGQNKSNQTSSIEVFCHHGTHIDTPLHVFPHGPTVADYGVEDFIFNDVLMVDVPKKDREPIGADDLEPYRERMAGIDLLLVRTGFGRHRRVDPQRYALQPPSFSEDGARFVIGHAPCLRAVGIDFPSVECLTSGRRLGWPVHKVFLGSRKDFLLIEDMNLTRLAESAIRRVIVAPLKIGTEASPATVLAELGPA